MNGAGLGSKYLVEAGNMVHTVTCFCCGSSCSRHRSIAPWPWSASPRCVEYHSRIWSRLADLKKTPPIPRMRPRCSILTGGFDFSGCGDCTSCPPFEHTEMSNSEPSAIVLQGIPCICGLYKVSIRMEKTVRFGHKRQIPATGLDGFPERGQQQIASLFEAGNTVLGD